MLNIPGLWVEPPSLDGVDCASPQVLSCVQSWVLFVCCNVLCIVTPPRQSQGRASVAYVLFVAWLGLSRWLQIWSADAFSRWFLAKGSSLPHAPQAPHRQKIVLPHRTYWLSAAAFSVIVLPVEVRPAGFDGWCRQGCCCVRALAWLCRPSGQQLVSVCCVVCCCCGTHLHISFSRGRC